MLLRKFSEKAKKTAGRESFPCRLFRLLESGAHVWEALERGNER